MSTDGVNLKKQNMNIFSCRSGRRHVFPPELQPAGSDEAVAYRTNKANAAVAGTLSSQADSRASHMYPIGRKKKGKKGKTPPEALEVSRVG